ncbi:RNA polymerase I enhancer binding protein [Aspergillus tubingensis]|uniref:RNA polymerase I enhancer binding protein n=1 Tax=Aspergillus tubingensis TaxID=5068 RepID=A0A9W6ERB5_ASPTU|nr:RNA polymerase I enhancer binding protein [Aspergillus tubingensis]GLA99609.1 RNA polymerase I enhancer binding protein [Aspergillus tubingensis]GLB21039.1 RNA polymerase I enhancer binding protein [Aspergillus tubingensis]
MGDSTSQYTSPGRKNAPEDSEEENRSELEIPSSPITPLNGAKQKLQTNNTTSGRKRRALDNTAGDRNISPASPKMSLSSRHNTSTDRPSKRKKVRESKGSQIQNGKADKATHKPDVLTQDVPSTSPSPGTEDLIAPDPGSKDQEKGSAQEESEAKLNTTSKQPSENFKGLVDFKKGKRGSDASKGKENKSTGFFTPEEVKALESFKLDFCTTHGMASDTFDLMIQHSERDKSNPFPCPTDITTKVAFWKNIYEIIPHRDKRSVYRFMRRHFQCTNQKPHYWTAEQDDELILLHERHGPRWAHIAKMIGRSDDDVIQRWRNHLEHRQTMNRGPWSEWEVGALLQYLQDWWTHMKNLGHEVGRDIYEIDESKISWGEISNRMENCRSRQQCGDKFRKIRRKVLTRRSMGNPDAFYDPVVEAKPPKRRGKSKSITPSQSQSNKHFKSSEYVDSDDESGEEGTETDKISSMDRSTSKTDDSSSSRSLETAPKKLNNPVHSQEDSDRPDPDTSISGSEESNSESEAEKSISDNDTGSTRSVQSSGKEQSSGHKGIGSLKRQRR